MDKFIHISSKNSIKIPKWKRAVVKVGSALIANEGKKMTTRNMLSIASFIIESRNQGKEIILVSSGAVAAGLSTQPRLAEKKHRSIPEKQALAAIGQILLMRTWSRLFDFPCAQLLLTYDDILQRKRFLNAENTLIELLKLKTLPIINENDTVAVDELKVGDNDNLAAYVAILAKADLFIICTDIDGLYESNPRENPDAKHILQVEKIDESIHALAGGTNSRLATGGMITKVQAAEKATSGGIHTIIMNGTKRGYFELILNNILCGTLFKKSENPIIGRKHWMLHALPINGTIFIDHGAANALINKGASLLPSGIIEVKGNFQKGNAVLIAHRIDNSIKHIAKGISHYSSHDLKKIIGKKSSEIEKLLDQFYSNEVIHRENLVLKTDF